MGCSSREVPIALTPEEAAHARSIVEPAALRPIPPERVTRILVASPIRKPPNVLQHFLDCLAWQRVRQPVEIHYLFAPNYGDEPWAGDAIALLTASHLHPLVWPNETPEARDYGDGAESRQWSKPAFTRLADLKNRMLQYAVEHDFDFVWLVDADVMGDPYTLQSLLDTADHESWVNNERTAPPIVAGVYWTRWQRPVPGTTQQVHAGPQVWLVHPYQLHGRGWTEAEFRAALIDRKRVRVYGLGACTLVPRHAIEKGVTFRPFDGLPPGPMAEGEDRHFCAWATHLHVPLIADAWPDIYHAYHPAEYADLPAKVSALHRAPTLAPVVGDLVSAKLELLEPVPDRGGRLMRLQARWLRGKYGTLPTLPQVEETLADLQPGESRLIRLHFPSHWPEPQLRLRTIVARVTLFDVKPFRAPPVVDEELFVGSRSYRVIDTTAHTLEQLDALTGHDDLGAGDGDVRLDDAAGDAGTSE